MIEFYPRIGILDYLANSAEKAKNLIKGIENVEKETLSPLSQLKQNIYDFNIFEEKNIKNTNMKNAFKTAGNTLKVFAKTPIGVAASILEQEQLHLG